MANTLFLAVPIYQKCMREDLVNVAYRLSAVARGGAGGARAPQFFFLKSKNRPV